MNSLSLVVPTWNEVMWLSRLLHTTRRCRGIAETIVADNNSHDGTARLAKDSGCVVVPGGRPAVARNMGASVARSDLLLFADADVLLTQNHVDWCLRILGRCGAVGVHFRQTPIIATNFVQFCYLTMDIYFRLLNRIGIPQGIGGVIATTRDAFKEVGGFAEYLDPGEDADFVMRLARVGNVHYVRDIPLAVSARRFFIESPPFFATKCLLWSLLRICSRRLVVGEYRWIEYPAWIFSLEQRVIAGGGNG